MNTRPTLTLHHTRILGVLVEKQRTVPDTYPLTLNALQAGCNQKTSRDPVLELSESDIMSALDELRDWNLISELSGARVSRFSHRMEAGLGIPGQSVAILATLMLRGPQTAAEIRNHCERLHRFADISAVEAFLEELSLHADGPLVVELPRQPGSRENRWAQTLTPVVSDPAPATLSPAQPELEARVAQLEQDVAELRQQLQQLLQEKQAS